MVEEKQENKKPGIFRRILKWIGLGLLALLLIAAIYFQAPWKVITLLVVLLLACTALPKPARKWFWLSVGVVVIALIIWVFLPDDSEGWRPYKYNFDKELASMETVRSIPNEQNAAAIYNKLLESYDANVLDPISLGADVFNSIYSGIWLSKEYPEAAKWLKGQQSTIETLLEAAKIEKCRFTIVVDLVGPSKSMDRLSAMRRWAYLLVIAANNNIAEGQIDEALEKQIAVLQMANHLYQQPTMLDLLVGIAVEALAIGQFDRFTVTGDATEERLNVVEEALAGAKRDWTSDLPRILECEKLMMKNLLGRFYETNPKGKTRHIRSIAAMVPQFEETKIKLSCWQRKLFKAGTVLRWFYMPSTPQKAAKIVDASYEKYYAMADPDFDWQKEPEEISINWTKVRFNYRYLGKLMASMLEEPYYRIHDLYLRVDTDKRGSRLLIALRRYKNKNGVWPESLDEVRPLASAEIFVDPQNGGAFVYKLTEENFTLYSKGKNNIDEDGRYKHLPGEEIVPDRSEERRVGKECRSRWSPYH